MKQKIALIGFGTVGQGFVSILKSHQKQLVQKYGLNTSIVAVTDKLKGSAYLPEGLDIDQLLDLVAKGDSLNNYSKGETGWSVEKTILRSEADIVCELTYTNIETGQPSADYCRQALSTGKHVVTSNKGPVALHYKELSELANSNNVHFLFEGTVMSGTPVLNLVRNELAGNEITKIQGVLNGTTNYILTQMEQGQAYELALKTAQELGYAEADPSADVNGLDSLAKVTILANTLMEQDLKPNDIPCTGITQVQPSDIQSAQADSMRWKLIGSIIRDSSGVSASVAPTKIDLEHPLAGISGVNNAITFTTQLTGDVTIVGPGAGKEATGFSILTDILEIHRNIGGLIY